MQHANGICKPLNTESTREHSPLGEASVSSLTRLELTHKENLLLFVCGEAAESKLETSHAILLPQQ